VSDVSAGRAVPDDPSRFPPGFSWGAATSAYQIEGAAREDGKGESIWDRFVRIPGAVSDGSSGEVACDHYHRWRDDIALMAELGLRAYRFSMAWARVMPDGGGPVNERGLAFYDRLVDGLLEAGIEPWVTLYHWDLPQALEDAGGWPARQTAERFAEYAGVAAARLGDRVGHWITVNEPWEIGILGYYRGAHAPGRKDLPDALSAIHTLLLGHGLGVQAIRAAAPRATVGITLSLATCYPASEHDGSAATRMDGHMNRWFLDPVLGRGYPPDMVSLYGDAAPAVAPGDLEIIAQPLDFLGINYYYSSWLAEDGLAGPLRVSEAAPPEKLDQTVLGWSVHPDGFYEMLVRLRDDYHPRSIVISESGAAFEDSVTASGEVRDLNRLNYHASYLDAVARARREGVPVDGYFAWSLFDNFEWQQGYGPRFGLVRVDYASQLRTVKSSGRWYARVIAEGRLVDPGTAD
jgi:beta-glucosidase